MNTEQVAPGGHAKNIVYLHTHDSGRYIQPYGHAIPTPNLLRLAQRGVIFRQAFSAAPTCSPSRAALLTGMSPHSCGMVGLAHHGFRVTDYNLHLASLLGRSGYRTVLSGVQHEVAERNVDHLGYETLLSPTQKHRGDTDLDNARRLAAFIRHHDDDRPFFASLGLFHTHRSGREFVATEKAMEPNYVLPPAPMSDCADNRRDMSGYIASAAVADDCIGIVLDALQSAGEMDNTMIIFTTDHGIPFPRMKGSLFDSGIGVALLVYVPGMPLNSRASDALVSQLDLVPTICHWAGLPIPAHAEGVSLFPLLTGRSDKVRSELFAETNYHAAYEPARCVRTERYKLIRFFDDYPSPVLCNIDDSASKDFMLDHGYDQRPVRNELLFDLALDPVEGTDLSNDPGTVATRDLLRLQLDEWMQATIDPLLIGKVPRPAGVRVHAQTSRSVSERNMEDD